MSPSPDLLLFTGRFHPLFVHLPIGILVLLVFLELLSLRARYQGVVGAVRPMLGLLIPASVVSVVCGLLLASGGGYDPELVRWHQFTGIAVGVASVLLYVLHRRGQVGAYRVLLAVAFGLLVVSSHYGGSLTHGRGYLTRYAPGPVRQWLGLAPAPVTDKPAPSTIAERIVFTDVIQPILEDNCVSCHGPEKSKGDLRVDSFAAILRGGELGPGVVPGKTAESLLLERMRLPLEHDDHMPPEGKPQPSADEVTLIEWWIASGASAEQTVAELPSVPEIARILAAHFAQPAATARPSSEPEPESAQ